MKELILRKKYLRGEGEPMKEHIFRLQFKRQRRTHEETYIKKFLRGEEELKVIFL